MSSIRVFRTFLAVAQSGTFSKAAQLVSLTTPAVAQQMRGLEAEVHKELFVRRGRTVELSSAGRMLASRLERLVDGYDELLAELRADELSGQVTIGVIISALGPVSHAVLPLKERYPGLRVRLLGLRSPDIARGVFSGKLDLGLMVEMPDLEWHGAFRWARVYEEPLRLIASARVAHPQSDFLEVLRRNQFIRYGDAQASGEKIDRILHRYGFVPNEPLELNSLPSIVELVRQNVGVAIIPMLKSARLESDASLCVLKPRGAELRRSIGIVESVKSRSVTETVKAQLMLHLKTSRVR